MLSERIGYLATIKGKFGEYTGEEVDRMGVQWQLDTIAKLDEFKRILHEEVERRGLRLEDVEACISSLYSKVSAHKKAITSSEVAAIASYLRLLREWGFYLPLWVLRDEGIPV
jgi:hypothetical protein